MTRFATRRPIRSTSYGRRTESGATGINAVIRELGGACSALDTASFEMGMSGWENAGGLQEEMDGHLRALREIRLRVQLEDERRRLAPNPTPTSEVQK